MPDFQLSPPANDAKLLGIAAYADVGSGNSRIQFFGTTKPAFGGSAGGSPLVEILLTKPCASLVGHAVVLHQADESGDLVMIEGNAVWGRWLNGNDDLVGDGDVSDMTGTAHFRVAGTLGTKLYGGARAILGTTALT